MIRISITALLLSLLTFSQGLWAASPNVEITMTTGVSANLKPKNKLEKLPRGAGQFTIYMKWSDLPTKKKWLVINDSDPITYTTTIFDGRGKQVAEDVHTFTPDGSDSVSWAMHDIKASEASGQWKVTLDVFGKTYEKSLKIYD